MLFYPQCNFCLQNWRVAQWVKTRRLFWKAAGLNPRVGGDISMFRQATFSKGRLTLLSQVYIALANSVC